MAYQAGDEAQTYRANRSNEWPAVLGSVAAKPTPAMLGNFKPDTLHIGELAKTTVQVQKVFDRAGWK